MTTIYLVRHGETEWNQQSRFQGASDIPLSPRGFQQAEALKNRLEDSHFSEIYSSDLKRAKQTAQVISDGQTKDPVVDARLREINFGEWEGLTYDQIQMKESDALAAWEEDLYNQAPPGGESLRQLIERVTSFWKGLDTSRSTEKILIVAHGGTLQCLICLLLNHDPEKYWQFHLSPASISIIQVYQAGAILNLHNDRHHLITI